MTDPREKILEAFLDEMLNHRRPQSVEETLRALNEKLQAGANVEAASPVVATTRILKTPPESPPLENVCETRVVESSTNKARTESVWSLRMPRGVAFAVAASALVTVSVGFWWIARDGNQNRPEVAEVDPAAQNAGSGNANQAMTPAGSENGFAGNETSISTPEDANPENGANGNSELSPEGGTAAPENGNPDGRPSLAENGNNRPEIPADQTALVNPGPFERDPTRIPDVTPLEPEAFAAEFNKRLRDVWELAGVQPSGRLEPRTWSVRLVSRVLGRTPTSDEVQALSRLSDDIEDDNKLRQALVSWLLDDPQRRQEFADHWGRLVAWRMLGISPAMQATDPDIEQTRTFIAEQIRDDASMDEVVYRLISATGSTDPDHADFNPAASYLAGLGKRFGKMELGAAHIADTLSGRQMQCIMCHDAQGPQAGLLATGEQESFYEYYSFFAQTRFEQREDGRYALINQNFLPLGNQGSVDAPLTWTSADGVEKQSYPVFGDLRPKRNGFVAIVDRRTQLAASIANSPALRSALTDTAWVAMMNVPLTGLSESRPEVQRELAGLQQFLDDQFAVNGDQMDWLVSAIANVEAFSLNVGEVSPSDSSNPLLGGAAVFNQFYPRIENRRSPVASLAILSDAYSNRDATTALEAGLLARMDGNFATSNVKSVMPVLPTNDNQWATTPELTAVLQRVAAGSLDEDEKIRHLVMCAFGRDATDDELAYGREILGEATDKEMALQDIWWALLNSIEFQLPALR